MSGIQLSFRPLSESDDAQTILKLLSELTKVDLCATQEDFARQVAEMRRRESHAFVGEHNGEIVCMGTMVYEAKLIRGMREAGHIEDIVVRSDYRGKHLGQQLISHLVEHARARGSCYKVFLDCEPTIKYFYERCGFEDKGCQMVLYL
jgi:glucosamine-phosphate N-acetyltransferase